MNKLMKSLLLALVSVGILSSTPAVADHLVWRGSFHPHDLHVWRGGHWFNGPHDGRLGWWWIVGGAWYFYPAAVYPYPDPYVPPVIVQAAPAAPVQAQVAPAPQFWYYCEDSKQYYPYAATCASAWKPVPATPAPSGK